MKTYLLSLFGASITVILAEIILPERASKFFRLVTSLFLVCVLIAPLPRTVKAIRDLTDELLSRAEEDSTLGIYDTEMQEAMDGASRTYFVQMLTSAVSERFGIKSGELTCSVTWGDEDEQLTVKRVTLILSGSAIWKDPAPMEEFVSGLLGCECLSAIK